MDGRSGRARGDLAGERPPTPTLPPRSPSALCPRAGRPDRRGGCAEALAGEGRASRADRPPQLCSGEQARSDPSKSIACARVGAHARARPVRANGLQRTACDVRGEADCTEVAGRPTPPSPHARTRPHTRAHGACGTCAASTRGDGTAEGGVDRSIGRARGGVRRNSKSCLDARASGGRGGVRAIESLAGVDRLHHGRTVSIMRGLLERGGVAHLAHLPPGTVTRTRTRAKVGYGRGERESLRGVDRRAGGEGAGGPASRSPALPRRFERRAVQCHGATRRDVGWRGSAPGGGSLGGGASRPLPPPSSGLARRSVWRSRSPMLHRQAPPRSPQRASQHRAPARAAAAAPGINTLYHHRGPHVSRIITTARAGSSGPPFSFAFSLEPPAPRRGRGGWAPPVRRRTAAGGATPGCG